MTILRTVEELERVYGRPKGGSVLKETTSLTPHYRALIEASPFVVLASVGPNGLDCSPKGDAPGFVRVIDDRKLALPDRLGNNRIDNLRNIVVDPRVSLLFIIPGVGETLRVNGRAEISTEAELLASFAVENKLPRSVILVTIEAVYFHCAKALMRSKLWDPSRHVERSQLPSTGEIIAFISGGAIDAQAHDREAPARLVATLY
jgi:PPOX class probable FMN-dependent enzyme